MTRSATIALALLCAVPLRAQEVPRLYEHVTVSRSHIAFTLGRQMYEVPIGGGTAVRLSTTPDDYSRPLYSPDGSRIAYTRAGSIWTIPTGGGTPTRLTFYPRNSLPAAWSPDGKEILFVSARDGDGNQRGLVVPATGGPERMLKLNPVRFASYSPNGEKLAVIGWSPFLSGVDRRFYRGGTNDGISLINPETGKGSTIALHGANAIQPMWIGRTVFYVADSLGSFNLAMYDTLTRRSQYLTSYRSHGIVAAAGSAQGSVIAFVRDGRIHVYDIATRQIRTPQITVAPDTAQLAPRTIAATQGAQSILAGPKAERVAIELRGEVLVVDPKTGESVNLSRSPRAADRTPSISPDGKRVAWFSDASGEYALRVAPTDGSGPGSTIKLGAAPTYFRGISWSPTGQHLAFSDQRLMLWVADLTAGNAVAVDSSEWIAQGLWQTSWSPDGDLLAYAKASSKGIRSIWIRNVRSGKNERLSRGGADDIWPVFDPTGRWLYFATSANSSLSPARDVWALQSDLFLRPFVSYGIVVAPLRAGDVLPLLPFTGAPNPQAATNSRNAYDIAGAGARALPLFVPAQNVEQLWMAPNGSLVAQVTRWPTTSALDNGTSELLRIDVNAAQRPTTLAADIGGAELSTDGSVAVVTRGGAVTLVPVAGGEGTPLDLSKVTVQVEPRAEWQQMYDEAFRMMRDYFYDPRHHGASIDELREHYRAYLPGLTRRAQLNDLLLYAFGEISVSHLNIGRGDDRTPGVPNERVGVLGADVQVVGNRFRITRIMRNGPYFSGNPLVRAPLDQGGGEVREGDYILAVDDVDVIANKPLEAYLIGKAGRPTQLRVASSPDGTNARTFQVVPSSGENGLRRANWAAANERRVAERTGGAVVYVYIDQWSAAGMAELARALGSANGAKALIIDERFNGGGITPDDAISWLERQPWYDYAYRYGTGFSVPQHAITGPKILITNEVNFSAAETFALMFQERKVGTIVGRRTGGGGIGGALFSQRLIDGGVVTIPNRASHNSRLGVWGIENHGVTPEVDVPITQEDAVAGRDPQLERAIDVALAQLKTYRAPVRKRPIPPVHPKR